MDSDSCSDSDNENNAEISGESSEENSSSTVENSYLSAEQLEKISTYEETTENAENGAANVEDDQIQRIPVPRVNIPKFLEFIDDKLVKNQLLRPIFQDVTPSFADEVPFLVDGDSLMITMMMDKNWSNQLGGSTLHLVYLFERYLNIFVQRGGTFHLVFFQNWRNIWHENWNVLLHRLVLINHFSRNTENYPVHVFDHCFDVKFINLVNTIRPGFILTNMDAYDHCSDFFKIRKFLLKHIMNINLMCWLKMDLPCIDTNFIEVNVSIVKGYYLDCNPAIRGIVNKHLNIFQYIISELPKIEECEGLPDCVNISEDIRTIIFLTAAYIFYKRNKDENMVKIFFLTAVMMEILELKNRCCPKFSAPLPELDTKISEWHKCMFFALSTIENENYDYSTIPDMWQGILFGHVCRFVTSAIDCSEKLGSEVGPTYEEMIRSFNNFGFSISAYPIALSDTNINFETIDFLTVSQTDPQPLIPIQNPLVLKFCSNILHDINWCDPPQHLEKKEYSEEHHYHSMKMITDEHDHVKDSIKNTFFNYWEKKRYIKERNMHAKFMTLYGSSIEGRPLQISGVIRNIKKSSNKKEKKQKAEKKAQENVDDTQDNVVQEETKNKELEKTGAIPKNKNSKKKQKPVNKAQAIIDDQNKKKYIEQEKKDKEQFKKLEAQYKNVGVDLESVLEQLNLKLMNKSFSEGSYKIDALCLKLKIMLKQNLINKSKETDKSIFLITKEILNSGCDLSLKRKELLSKCLSSINCSEIAKRNNLPFQIEPSPEDDVWIRFQLKELGSELTRETGGRPDSRVSGFIPDPWQSELFDIVDKRQSALIVAPTSSGKTYASYYCMESVLKEGIEGIVVYVAPTKALVNQVAATVYARFKDTPMPDGKSVYGVFTRDYRMHALTSQILITVPQCLEVLLLSPRRHSWMKNLRYIIFDEIHCIEGELGGASFERCLLLIRCPFLALSATIRNPRGLHKWLQKAESYKHDRDIEYDSPREENSYKVHLVIHSERHSDLTKFNYGSGQLHHLHPYAELEASVMRKHKGIPSHMTLSPAETLQLYDVMCKVYSESEKLKQLSPLLFFSSHSENGFICRNLVRKYVSDLSKVLEDWFENNTKYFEDTLSLLRHERDQIDGTGHVYIICNIAKLIKHLKEQNMLPALVFAYDRNLIVRMMRELTEYLEKKKQITSRKIKCKPSTSKANKPVSQPAVSDHLETKKYKAKALNSFSGNAEKNLEHITGKMNYIDKKNVGRYPTRYEKPLNLISEDADQTLQGIGVMTSEDMVFIEQRLRRSHINSNNLIVRAMRNGICLHHGGLNARVRTSVEMLFQKKFLNVVFATGTLALGIHMPCKTAVIAGNSAYLNSLEYHQMSGRAGRRGYDTAGNVIFLGLNNRKQHSLLTAKLPYLKGNFPVTVTLILRTLLLVSDVTDKNKKSQEATNISISRVMAMLENSLCYMENSNLKINIKHFFSFTLQLLKIQDFINDNGDPLKWCGLATHLHYHEPGNLAFVYLLRTGAIRRLCLETKNDKDIQYKLVVILCHLFTRVPLDAASKEEFNNSVVVLDPLPEAMREALELYNEQVHFVFNQYFVNVANHFNEPDNVLPLSSVRVTGKTYTGRYDTENLQNKFLNMCIPKLVCSSFAALSGNNDDNAYTEDTLISNLKQKMATDVKVIPLINLNSELNGYALDFYRHGIIKSIIEDNGIKAGAEFTLLTDFLLVIKTIRVSLEEMKVKDEGDIVYRNFKQLEDKYGSKHAKAFGRVHY